MRAQLLLALTGDQLALTLSQPAQPRGWGARLRTLLRTRRLPAQATAARPAATTQLTVDLTTGPLTETLEPAWSALQKQLAQTPEELDLSVQLGLAHARLGLLQLAEESGTPTKAAAIEGYAKAWIQQMWGMDPATQIIRWDRVENSSAILISCIDHAVFDELQAFSRRRGLRFVSCKPAVLNALESPHPSTGKKHKAATESARETTIVWTEPSSSDRRASLVQLLHCTGSQPKALWRGWLPTPASSDEPDEALHGAIRRFRAASRLPENTPLEFMHWAEAAQPPRAAGASA